jgi:hypothetical protein
MTITLDLQPEELTALNARAQAQGVDIETVLHGLIAQIASAPAQEIALKPNLPERNTAAISLIQGWREEDQTEDLEEREQRDRDLQDFKANINRWRVEQGRPPAFL